MRKSISLLGLFYTIPNINNTSRSHNKRPYYRWRGGGCDFIKVFSNDAGHIYNLTYTPTFFTAIVNLTGTYSFNFTEAKKVPCAQVVVFYIALGTSVTKNYITESAYIQPVIVLCFFDFCLNGKIGYGWGLKYVIRCTTYCVNTGNINYYMPEGPINIKDIGAITFNNGSMLRSIIC